MKFGSIMESHTWIPYPLLVLGYDDPKGSQWVTHEWFQLKNRIVFVVAQTQYACNFDQWHWALLKETR